MYELTKEDIQNLVNYREFCKSVKETTNDEALKMMLTKSVGLLEGDITSQTMVKYMELVKSTTKVPKAEPSEEFAAKMVEIKAKSKEYQLVAIINKVMNSMKE